jgi:hypothetical protein
MPWSKRLKNSLTAAKSDIVMVMVEDFFLRSPINYEIFSNFVRLIADPQTKIDHIRLTLTLNKIDLIPSEYDDLDEIAPRTKMRFTYLPGLWKRKVLAKYVTNFESPFLSETMGRYRSWVLKDGFYAVSKNYIRDNGQFYDSEPSGIIFKGRWPRWVPDLFEKEGIYMDFSIRGIADKAFREKTRINSKKQILKEPIPFFRSIFNVLNLYVTSMFGFSRNSN